MQGINVAAWSVYCRDIFGSLIEKCREGSAVIYLSSAGLPPDPLDTETPPKIQKKKNQKYLLILSTRQLSDAFASAFVCGVFISNERLGAGRLGDSLR